MCEPIEVDAGETPVAVTAVLKPGLGASATVTLVDQDAQPVSDAKVTLWEWTTDRSRQEVPAGQPDARGVATMRGLRVGGRYQLQLATPRCDPAESAKWTARAGATEDLGTIVLPRYRGFLAGVVVDEAGAPVAGATVVNRVDGPRGADNQVVTDQQGRFRLEGLAEGEAYAFVEAPGCHPTAVLAPTGTEDMRITVHPRAIANAGPPLPPPGPALPPEEARVLARQLLVQVLGETADLQGTDVRDQLLERLAEVDPEAAAAAAAPGEADAAISRVLGVKLLTEDLEGGIALLRQGGPGPKVIEALCRAARACGDDQEDVALRCLEEAQAQAGLDADEGERLTWAARVGHLLRRFDPDRAAALLDQARQAAGLAAQAGRAERGVAEVAVEVSTEDLGAALALVDQNRDEFAHSAALARIACRVAAGDPDTALQVLDRIRWPDLRPVAQARMVAWMPADQADRALAIAREIPQPFFRGLALMRLSTVAPVERRAPLIEEAADQFAVPSQGASIFTSAFPSSGLAHLACLARRLGYDAYEDLALRAARLYGEGVPGYTDPNVHAQLALECALQLSFTTPEMAHHLVDAVLRRTGGVEQLELAPDLYPSLAAAAAGVDPRWAATLVEQMEPDQPQGPAYPRTEAVLRIAAALLDPPKQREWELLRSQSPWSVPWVPDEEVD